MINQLISFIDNEQMTNRTLHFHRIQNNKQFEQAISKALNNDSQNKENYRCINVTPQKRIQSKNENISQQKPKNQTKSSNKKENKEKLKTYKELDEEANMTFQPKLIAKHNKYLGERDISFIERNKLWQDELKQKRVNVLQSVTQQEEKEIQKQCTFKPSINRTRILQQNQNDFSSNMSQTKKFQLPLKTTENESQFNLNSRSFQQAVGLLHQELHSIEF